MKKIKQIKKKHNMTDIITKFTNLRTSLNSKRAKLGIPEISYEEETSGDKRYPLNASKDQNNTINLMLNR